MGALPAYSWLNQSGLLLNAWGHAAPWARACDAARRRQLQARHLLGANEVTAAVGYHKMVGLLFFEHRLRSKVAFLGATQQALQKPHKCVALGMVSGALAAVASPPLGGPALAALTAMSLMQLGPRLGLAMFGSGMQGLWPLGAIGYVTEKPLLHWSQNPKAWRWGTELARTSLAAACACRFALQAVRLPLAVLMIINAAAWGLVGVACFEAQQAGIGALASAAWVLNAAHKMFSCSAGGQKNGPYPQLAAVARLGACQPVAPCVSVPGGVSAASGALLRKALAKNKTSTQNCRERRAHFRADLRRISAINLGQSRDKDLMALPAHLARIQLWFDGPGAQIAYARGNKGALRLQDLAAQLWFWPGFGQALSGPIYGAQVLRHRRSLCHILIAQCAHKGGSQATAIDPAVMATALLGYMAAKQLI